MTGSLQQNRERLATLSDSSNDSGDLSLSCSVSSVESEQSEVEGDLETVEAHQFEPVVASAESDYRGRR